MRRPERRYGPRMARAARLRRPTLVAAPLFVIGVMGCTAALAASRSLTRLGMIALVRDRSRPARAVPAPSTQKSTCTGVEMFHERVHAVQHRVGQASVALERAERKGDISRKQRRRARSCAPEFLAKAADRDPGFVGIDH